MSILISKLASEVWVKSASNLRISKTANEMWGRHPSRIRISKLANEVWTGVGVNQGIGTHVGIPLIISIWHEAGNVFLRVNGHEISFPSGNTTDLTGSLRLAASALGLKANMKFFEAATFNQVPPQGTRLSLEENLRAWLEG
jgi:hypothetical protein